MPILFRDRALPREASLAGYAHIVDALDIRTVLPHRLHAVAPTQTREKTTDWVIHSVTRWPGETIVDHLVFALKNEGVNLLILKQCFLAIGPDGLAEAIRRHPTSSYLRRLSFLYEWLLDEELDLPTIGGNYVDAIDTRVQYAGTDSINSQRHRVRDNLPGSRSFCPLVWRTRRLDAYLDADLAMRARRVTEEVPAELLRRAAAFLMLNDSRASFEIESERPSADRATRWAQAIGRAGRDDLSIAHLEALQKELIEDARMVTLGLRTKGGFVGEHDLFGQPRPKHISARPEDLHDLISGLVAYDRLSRVQDYPAVLAAASLAFGFVYIHPFEDGNGRVHRYLIHHVLATRAFAPGEIVFPVSVAILADILRYRDVLETLSRPLLDVTDWQVTDKGNIAVLNETADYHRFFDATRHAEFLFACIERTIDVELRDELRYLDIRDRFHARGTEIIDMPERKLDLMLRMLRQQSGQFSARMREREFAPLTNEEVVAFKSLYAELNEPAYGPHQASSQLEKLPS